MAPQVLALATSNEAPDVELAVQQAPVPVFMGQQMVQALTAYKELQGALDRAMPDQLMKIEKKVFRKKGYWRALAVAFNLDVQLVSEERAVDGAFADGRENFGYLVNYLAKAPNGRSKPGDGACFAVEKAPKFKCPHPHVQGWKGKSLHWPHETCPDFSDDFQWKRRPSQATVHNIRSHAHTRAYNRAVSNLVGFGEVSAEEIERGEQQPDDYVMSAPDDDTSQPDAPQAPARERLTLADGQFEILGVRTMRYGGELRVRSFGGEVELYPIPDRECVALAEQVYQEHVPVTLDRVKGVRDGKIKVKAIHRVGAPVVYAPSDKAGDGLRDPDAPLDIKASDIPF
jgi:hypothetical protein